MSRGGGAGIAELLGGRLLDLDTSDPDERRLLNVVEEMAIASGLPVPDVYLLDEEHGINAFAAGNDISDAVQFTRNPDGLVGALRKIGGLAGRSKLDAARTEEASHMYFGDGMSRRWFRYTATHPPLTDRIRRIQPHFDGQYPTVSIDPVLRESRLTVLYRQQAGPRPVDFDRLASVIGPTAAAQEVIYAHAARGPDAKRTVPVVDLAPRVGRFSTAQLEYAALFLSAIPDAIRAATRQPFSAVALVYGMICGKDPTTRAELIAEIADTTEPGILSELSRMLPVLDQMEADTFLPLTELCLRPLRRLSPSQYDMFRDNLRRLVEHDRQIDLFEYMLERMIVRHLDPQFRPVKRPPMQYYVLRPLLPECAVLLSGLAHVGHDTEPAARAAFQSGADQLGADSALRFLPSTECNLPQMDVALERCAQASPRLKQQIIQSLVAVVATDGQVKRREAELLRAIADTLDCPIPPFLNTNA